MTARLRPAPGRARSARRWILLGPLLLLPLLGVGIAAATGAFRDAGRVTVRLDGAAADGTVKAGGIAFSTDAAGDELRARVDRGQELVVLGYTGEQALRVHPDGRSELNENATIGSAGPDDPQPAAPPDPGGPDRWIEVGTEGRISWHDHRAHWYAGSPTAADGEVVGQWVVPIRVDGADARITGALVWNEPQPGRLALVAAVATLTAAALLRWRRPPSPTAAIVLGLAAFATAGVVAAGAPSALDRSGVVAAVMLVFVLVVSGGWARIKAQLMWGVSAVLGLTWILLRWHSLLLPSEPGAPILGPEAVLFGIALGAEVVVLVAAFSAVGRQAAPARSALQGNR